MNDFKLLIEIIKLVQDNSDFEYYRFYEIKIDNIQKREPELTRLPEAEFENIVNDEIHELDQFLLSHHNKHEIMVKMKTDHPRMFYKLSNLLNEKINKEGIEGSFMKEKEYWNTGWEVYKKINDKNFTKKWFSAQKAFKKMVLIKIKTCLTKDNLKLFKIILNPGKDILKEDLLNLLIYIAIRSKKGYYDFIERPDKYGKILFNPFNKFTLYNFLDFFHQKEIENIWKEIDGKNILRKLNELDLKDMEKMYPKTIKNFKLRKFI